MPGVQLLEKVLEKRDAVDDAVWGRIEGQFDKRRPARRCCCCCSLERGIYVALFLFSLESTFHLVIAYIRPQWEWTSTGLTIFAYWLQNMTRIALLILSMMVAASLCQRSSVRLALKTYFRLLVLLLFLEVIEIFMKFAEVHAICDAPEVWAARNRSIALGRNHTFSEPMCELVSNLYDFAWGLIHLAVGTYMAHIVRSYYRLLPKTGTLPREVAVTELAGGRVGEPPPNVV